MTISKTIYKDYFFKSPDVRQKIMLRHVQAEEWAAKHNITVTQGDVYAFANLYEFETEEDLLAFILQFGDLEMA